MINILYAIVIFPIEQIIEIFYTLIYKVFTSPGISIIGVSLTVTFLSLPLYIIAEKWQEQERQTIRRLKPKTDKIKQVFKGDEQYMILSTYYHQNGYHPIYSLRNSLNVLIQIPFFIAVYNFLSHLQALQNASFLFINDMSKPDTLLSIGNVSINVLPVVMTAINCIAGAIYTKGFGLRDKIQVYGVALVFLILLYNSPAGLVLYWTGNNILSLVKNIFYKIKNPIKALYFIASACAFAFIFYLLFLNDGMFKKRLLLSFCCSLIFLIPLFVRLYVFLQNRFLFTLFAERKKCVFLFLAACVVLAVLIGFFIPSSVIVSSPEEFSFIEDYRSPLPFIFNTFFKSAGIFVFWPLCIYFLFGKKAKAFLTFLFLFLTMVSLLNVFIFQGSASTISNTFTFNDSLSALNASGIESVLNIVCTFAFLAIILLLIKHKYFKIISTSLVLFFVSLFAFSAYNIYTTQEKFTRFASLKKAGLSDFSRIQPVFHLSKEKQNLVIIMADQAIGGFLKPIFDEQPILYEQFEGFTWFPNTVSFAMHTIMGIPALWGGYEYTPREMNRRSTLSLVEKHNESLLVLPRILSEAGYNITITDPSLANYASTNDTSIYEKYENIQAFNTIGRYTDIWYSVNGFNVIYATANKINRNALWFSFLKSSPPFLRKFIYDDSKYWETGSEQIAGAIEGFINSYAVIDFLPELTVYDSQKPSALLITNETPHQLVFLQYPSYTPSETVTDKGNGEFSDNKYFHVNSAFYLKVGEWFEELKKNQVYDNTRIIIVSDHGHNMNAKIANTELSIPNERREAYNPVLLVKDFNSKGRLRTDMSFMTNADVPAIALDNIASAINPFTGNSLVKNYKNEGVYITTNHLWQPFKHRRATFNIDTDQWIFVKENIFNSDNWTKVKF